MCPALRQHKRVRMIRVEKVRRILKGKTLERERSKRGEQSSHLFRGVSKRGKNGDLSPFFQLPALAGSLLPHTPFGRRRLPSALAEKISIVNAATVKIKLF